MGDYSRKDQPRVFLSLSGKRKASNPEIDNDNITQCNQIWLYLSAGLIA